VTYLIKEDDLILKCLNDALCPKKMPLKEFMRKNQSKEEDSPQVVIEPE